MPTLKMCRKTSYAIIGIILGIGAPVTWLIIKILFFSESNSAFLSQLVDELTLSAVNIALYLLWVSVPPW